MLYLYRCGQFKPNQSRSWSLHPQTSEPSSDYDSSSPMKKITNRTISNILEDLDVSPAQSDMVQSGYSSASYKPSTSDMYTSPESSPVKRSQVVKGKIKSTKKSGHVPYKGKGKKSKKLSCKEKRGWTKEKEDLLVQLWEDESLLYDFRNRDYKNNTEREKAYKRIAANLDMNGETICYES